MKPDTSKYKKVVIGTNATPLPVWDVQTGLTGALASAASGITLYTEREGKNGADVAQEIYADLMRNLPSRSMLPHLIHELTERDPDRVDWDKHSFLCGYMGPPSIGKSYMIKSLGKLTHPRGCLYLNCKDIDMGTIFCETVFDTSAANREKAAIDARILQGNEGGEGISAASAKMLKNALGDAFIEEERNGKTLISIDWNGIQVKGNTPEEQNYQKQVIREAISQVCQNENIVMQADAGQIGITTRDGIAIRAANPKSADYGRPVLLDEINRAKPGTLQKLYEFFAMLSDPKVETFQVTGGENIPFTFRRADLPVSYRMNFTGNPSTRGMGSADMDRPLISRFGVELDIRTVPDPALHDYADRITQSLTGVPLTQIYYSAKPMFDKNPEKLVEAAKLFRLHGLSDAKKLNVPEEEMLNISQAMRTIQLSEQLAEFFSSLKSIFNPESPVFQASRFSLSEGYETYLSGLEVDLRLVSKLLEKASVVEPKIMAPEAVDYSTAFSSAAARPAQSIDLDDRLGDRGQRLESYLLQWLHQVLVPADAQTRNIRPEECRKVLKMAQTLAAHCGIGDLPLKESLRGGIEHISDLYDFDRLSDTHEKYKVLRDVLVDTLREKHPELQGTADEILSVADTERAVAQAGAVGSGVVVADMEAGNFGDKPFTAVKAVENEEAAGTLVSRDAFLAALAIPELREATIAGLWNKSLLDEQSIEPSDESVRIAANASDSGFAVTTVMVEHDGKEEPLHLLQAAAKGSQPEDLIVMSGSLDKRLGALLKSGGVTCLDYRDIDAPRAVNDAIQKRIDDNPAQEKIRRSLSAAFLLRNGRAGEEARHDGKSLGELMASMQSLEVAAPLRLAQNNKGRGPV